MHKSRLGTVIIDCQTDDLESEAQFWRAALGGDITSPSPGGRYIDLQADPSDPHVIFAAGRAPEPNSY